ncbi:Protein FAM149B1, partial [Stegodyphus mimosarum]
MTRRLLDKKIIEISFLDSSNEYGDNLFPNWKLDISSDEELFIKDKSEILWSRDNNSFSSENDIYRETLESFSDMTTRTTSSCSWHNDEFDIKSINKVNASLEAIEDALYERKESPFINQELFQECCDWSDRFPFLRLKGEQIIKPIDDSVMLYSSNGCSVKPCSSENTSLCLQVEGKKMSIHTPCKNLPKMFLEDASDDQIPDYIEEIIEENGNYEEYLALDSSELCDKEILSTQSSHDSSSGATVKSIQEKIIDRLALEMWPKVIDVLNKLSESSNYGTNENFQLPPILATTERKPFSLQRPKTEGMSLEQTEFPKLSSILSVSPKVLQQRKDYGNGNHRITRPNSEISLLYRLHDVPNLNDKNESSKESELSFQHKFQSSTSRQEKLILTKVKKEEKDNGSFNLFLPVLEEDHIDFSDVLRGFHIEPEAKEVSSKSVWSSRLSEMSIGKKSECFLPPIHSANSLPTNANINKDVFTFYGNDVKNEKIKDTGPDLYMQGCPISRPNTSTSKKGMKSRRISHEDSCVINS